MQRDSVLFSPLEIGGLTLRNRITMAPLFVGYAGVEGTVNQLVLDHYMRMADSGAALIVVENAGIDPAGLGSPFMIRIDDDSCVTGLTALAKVIHQAGAKAIQQINHAGRYAYGRERIAPSPVAIGEVIPREMTARDFRHVIGSFAASSKRVKSAGFDGVELHGGTGYLLSQFLSPRLNRRSDEYGGALENRMRFPLEVLDAVRDAVGGGFPVGYRFLADELLPGGFSMDEAVVFARELEKRGIAYLSVMAGTHESFKVPPYADMEKEEGYMVPFAAGIKETTPHTPVIAAGRIQTPAYAEKIIEEGKTDLIGLARVLFADPLWPKKAQGVVSEPIIPCGESCSLCTRMTMLGKPLYCSRWTREERTSFLEKTGQKEEE